MERGLKQMNLNGNLPENWKSWRQKFENYLIASETDKKSEKVQCAQLLYYFGEEAINIYNTFSFKDGEQDKIKLLFQKFEEYFVPKKNLTYERYKFFNLKQNKETVEHFVKELKIQAKQCEFGNLTSDLIKTMLICGINDEVLREKLLQNQEKDLEKVIEACTIWENTKIQNQQLSTNQEKTIYNVKVNSQRNAGGNRQVATDFCKNREGKSNTNAKEKDNGNRSRRTFSSQQSSTDKYINNCTKCGRNHKLNECSAYGKTCNKCKKLNHFANMCTTKNKKIDIVCNEDYVKCLQIESISNKIEAVNKNKNAWFVDLEINNVKSSFKVDTGAEANIININKFQKHNLDLNFVKKCETSLCDYNNQKIEILGKIKLNIKHKNVNCTVDFFAVDGNKQSIISFITSEKLGLVNSVGVVNKVNHNYSSIIKQFETVFKGIGKLESTYKIEIQENAIPVMNPIRKVPFALEDKFKKCLAEMEKSDIIERVEGTTEWLNSFVIVLKTDGSLRICLDPRNLNKVIKRQQYKLPTIDEIMVKLNRSNYFTTLDATSGFWNIPLDENSSNLSCFGTPYGRFKFKRLPFGIVVASEVFQEKFKQIFNIPGVEIYIDDILIHAETKEIHDKILIDILKIAKEHNIKFNLDKCKFGVNEISYLGYTFSSNGAKVDKDKIKAITEMKSPENKKDLQRFLGMVTYVSRFVSNLSEKTAPLREILKENNSFVWGQKQEQAFKEIKIALINSPCLKYFNPREQTVISVDASKNGLGAVLMQKGIPCAYASKAMTETQQRYAQIEKELLAICFGIDKFQQYIFGQRTIVESDHKPLVPIFKKNLHECPARLQRMLLRLQKFDIEVRYKPGKELVIADTLSRANLKEEYDDKMELDIQICSVINKISITDTRLQELINKTDLDEEFKLLKNYVIQGWPKDKKTIPDNLKSYFNFRNEITFGKGLFFKGNKILIPKSERRNILKNIHSGHFGINKCIQRANTAVFWPRMNLEIENYVNKCEHCQKFGNSKTKETLIVQEVIEIPWYKIGMDIFELRGEHYLIVVDYYSKYVEIKSLNNNLTSSNVITKLKSIFSRHGIPAIIITDSGKQLISKEMMAFANEWKFEIKSSSPHHQQCNGMVERTIGTIKRLLKKTIDENGDIYLTLLAYRNTPVYDLYSPTEILMSRKLRDNIVKTKDMLEPKLINKIELHEKIKNAQSNYKRYYDKRTTYYPEFQKGDLIYYQTKPMSTWKKGRILEKEKDRTYQILTEDGYKLRRNKHFIKRRGEEVEIMQEESESKSVKNCDINKPVLRSNRLVKIPTKYNDYVMY